MMVAASSAAVFMQEMIVNLEIMSKDQLIAKIDELESQVVALRGGNQVVETLNLQSAFDLTEYEARFLRLLADGRPRTKAQVLDNLYYDKLDNPPEPKIVDVWLCKLRAKVGRYGVSIETIWGVGYRLLEGDDVVAAALKGEAVSDLGASPEIQMTAPGKRKSAGYDKQRALAELIERADKDGVVSFQSREFAASTGIGRTVSSILSSLEYRGLVEVISRASNHNTNRLNWIVRVTPLALHGAK